MSYNGPDSVEIRFTLILKLARLSIVVWYFARWILPRAKW